MAQLNVLHQLEAFREMHKSSLHVLPWFSHRQQRPYSQLQSRPEEWRSFRLASWKTRARCISKPKQSTPPRGGIMTSGEQGVFAMFLSDCVCCKPGWAVLHYTRRSWGTGALAERLKGIFNTTWSAAVKPWAQIGVWLCSCGMCPVPSSCFSATKQSPSSLESTPY